METNGFGKGDYSDCIRQNNFSYGKNNHRKEEVGDRMSPEKEKSRNYIEHRVSKMDTLAGVAIKYGVEVTDIKRMNNLVTDLQMFALKTLQIPLPGRHPPSPNLANGLDTQGPSSCNQTPIRRRHSDLFDSFQALKPKSPPQTISPAMSSLQGYYGIKPANQKIASEGFEMAVYRNGGSNYLEDVQSTESSPFSNPPLSLDRKSKSLANNLFSKSGQPSNNVASTVEKSNERFMRRRQKSESDFNSTAPELLIEGNNSNGVGFSKITGEGLALRSTRTSSGVDSESEKPKLPNYVQINASDSIVQESSFSLVKKSSSTSCLQDQETCVSSASSSIWPTGKWNLKADLQALSAAVITSPIFDGLPKPITGRKNKAALD